MWPLLVIAVLNVAGSSVGYVVYVRSRTKSTAPPILLGLSILSAFAATFVGGFSGLVLIAVSDEGAPVHAILVAITMILFICAVLGTASFYREARRSRRHSRISEQPLATEEVLALIRAGRVEAFSKEEGVVTVFLTPDPTVKEWSRLRRADAQDYAAFVATANEVCDQVGVITYHNDSGQNDPASPGSRWITPEEATALLNAGKISTFCHGVPEPSFIGPGRQGRMTFHGARTGIQLIDYGWVRHIYVTPALESTMIPIARAAQARLGKPQFNVNGRYEYP
jgi:hypothetical protein